MIGEMCCGPNGFKDVGVPLVYNGGIWVGIPGDVSSNVPNQLSLCGAAAGADATICKPNTPESNYAFSRVHTGGRHFLLANGSVR